MATMLFGPQQVNWRKLHYHLLKKHHHILITQNLGLWSPIFVEEFGKMVTKRSIVYHHLKIFLFLNDFSPMIESIMKNELLTLIVTQW